MPALTQRPLLRFPASGHPRTSSFSHGQVLLHPSRPTLPHSCHRSSIYLLLTGHFLRPAAIPPPYKLSTISPAQCQRPSPSCTQPAALAASSLLMSALYSHGNSPQPLPLATVAFILYTPSGHCCLHLHMRTRSPATTAFHVSSHYTWAAILLPAEDRPLHLPQPANLLSLHSSTATVLPATVTGHSFSCYSHQPFSLLPAISRGHCCPSPQRLSAL